MIVVIITITVNNSKLIKSIKSQTSYKDCTIKILTCII